MKKIITVVLTLTLVVSLFGCSAASVAPATETAAAGEAQLTNPVHELSEAELLEKTGISFTLPEGAENAIYSYIEGGESGALISQLCFTFSGADCTVRVQPRDVPGDSLPDISGLYYDWAENSDGDLGYNKAYFHYNPDAEGYVAWYDYAPGLLYCFSMSSGASVEALSELAETVCPAPQSETGNTVGDGSALDNMTPEFEPASFLPESVLPATVDLNGDGQNEELAIELIGADGFGDHIFVLTDSEGMKHEAKTIIQYNATVCLADIDSDGCFEILLSGDCGSDDYISYAWRWDGELKPIMFSGEVRRGADGAATAYADGAVESVDGIESKNVTITLGSFTYMLGTYGSVRPYVLNDKGEIAPVPGSLWDFTGNEIWLETAAELSYVPDGEKAADSCALPVGSKLLLKSTDGISKLYFTTADDSLGYFEIEFDEKTYGFSLNGVDEYSAFVSLPYAG